MVIAWLVGATLMSRQPALIALLADGAPHSAAALAAKLGTPPSLIAAAVSALADLGLEVRAGVDGYQLREPLDLLDEPQLVNSFSENARAQLSRLEVHAATASTNAELLDWPRPPLGRFSACVAEFQTAGRGRRGRAWIAPYASGLCLSFGWLFARAPAALAALSLAAGVAVLRALGAAGVRGLALKWPNDILLGGQKLGGVLSELRSDAGCAYVVIGVGLNVRLPPAARAAIREAGGLAPAELSAAGYHGSRSDLAARLIEQLSAMAQEFERDGFGPFRDEWQAVDALADRSVRVSTPTAERDGIARGIDAEGALRLEIDGHLEQVLAGEVSLRAVA